MFRLSYDFSQIAFLETNSVFSHLSWVFTHCLIWCKRSFWKTPYFRLSHSMITIVCNFRNNGGNGLKYNEIVLPAAKLDWKREIGLGEGSHHQYLRYHRSMPILCRVAQARVMSHAFSGVVLRPLWRPENLFFKIRMFVQL